MTAASRRTVQVQPEQETNPAPGAFQNHIKENDQEQEEDEEWSMIEKSANADYTPLHQRRQGESGSEPDASDSSLHEYLE
jgi:hypothetical protein